MDDVIIQTKGKNYPRKQISLDKYIYISCTRDNEKMGTK